MRFRWKWSGSGNGSCPSMIETDEGFIIIGAELDASTRSEVEAIARDHDSGIGEGETAVFVPKEIRDSLIGS